MATLSGTFTTKTATAFLNVGAGESATVILTKTGGTMTIRVEKQVGSAFEVIGSHTADTSGTVYYNPTKEPLALRLSVYEISGASVAYSLADTAAESQAGYPIRNAAGTTVLNVTDVGIETPAATVTAATVSTLTVTSTTAMAVNPTFTQVAKVGAAATIATAVSGPGVFQTTLTISGALTVTDALAYAGTKIFDFPEGRLYVLSAIGSMQFGITTADTTINPSAAMDWSVGTATASNITLATTMVDLIPKVDSPLAAEVVTLNTATTGTLAAAAFFDGTGTAKDAFLNVAFPTNTEIDADGTLNCVGTITILWGIVGDV